MALDCVVDSVKDPESGITTVYLDPGCTVQVHCIEQTTAQDLDRIGGCSCGEDSGPVATMAPQIDEIRKLLMQLAEAINMMGIDEFECKSTSSLGVACCRSWNRLIGAVRRGSGVTDAANEVMAVCMGVG